MNENKNEIEIIVNENLYSKSNFYLKNKNMTYFLKIFIR